MKTNKESSISFDKDLHDQFVPYGIALLLKEVGFDKNCFGFWSKEKEFKLHQCTFGCEEESASVIRRVTLVCKAPLYQQALDWFEELGYRNYVASNVYDGKTNYWFAFNAPGQLVFTDSSGREFKKDAQIACLRKLIEFKKDEVKDRIRLGGDTVITGHIKED